MVKEAGTPEKVDANARELVRELFTVPEVLPASLGAEVLYLGTKSLSREEAEGRRMREE